MLDTLLCHAPTATLFSANAQMLNSKKRSSAGTFRSKKILRCFKNLFSSLGFESLATPLVSNYLEEF